MLALLLALASAAPEPGLTPAGIYRLALADLGSPLVPPERRYTTRYASLHGVPEAERDSFVRAFHFAANSTSSRARFARPPVVNGVLLRIDLADLGWDRYSRRESIAKLKAAGIDTSKFTEDVWESIGAADPFFKATIKGGPRGWLNPYDVEAARVEAHTNYLVVSASWLLTRLLVEKQDGGFYSDLLLLPPTEKDLLKRFTDIDTINRENLKRGAVTVESIVALNGVREVQEIPGLFGYDVRFIWRTFDFIHDGSKPPDPKQDPYETLGGKARHDGREVIGTLPNGLHWYYLCDGGTGRDDGKQVNVVPQNIAIDKRVLKAKTYDRNVVNAIACVRCHGPSGILQVDDAIGRLVLDDEATLKVKSHDKAFAAAETARLEDYFLDGLDVPGGPTGLETRVGQQQASYFNRVLLLTGLNPAANGDAVTGFFDRYYWAAVEPEQAALEMGYTLAEARQLWKAASDVESTKLGINIYNPPLAMLRAGTPIRRVVWERDFGEALRAQLYPWEIVKGHGSMFTLIVAAGLGQCIAPGTYAATNYNRATGYGHAATYTAPAIHATNFVGFVAVDPYHSTVGAAARVEAKAAADAKVTADLTAQIAALNTTIATLAGPPPGPQAAPPAPGQPAAFTSVLTAKCAGCHNPAKQSGGLSFVDAKGELLALDAETKFAMLDSVATKRMPKTKEAGSPEARRAIADWLKADSDAILAALKDTK